MQQVTDRWTSYRSPEKGEPYLNARPHWAKEWQGLTVRGKPIESYLRKMHIRRKRKEFVRVLEEFFGEEERGNVGGDEEKVWESAFGEVVFPVNRRTVTESAP
jgi:hypothetical protein